MHSKVVALALAGSGASAAVLPRGDGCCFEVTASGGESGTVGQLGDGQNRIGGGYSPATYCINNGGITDSNGRGCILTPPTTQWQCDVGASPTIGFSISSEGGIEYNGSGKFYACGATSSEYNIYTTPVEGQKDCVEVTLSSGGKCSGNGNGGGASSSPASMPVASTIASKPASSKPASEKSTAPAQSTPAKPSSSAPASAPPSSSAMSPPGYQSKPSAPPASSTEQAPVTTSSVEMTTSTVYTTKVSTVTSCAASVKDCPAESQTTAVVTKTIAVSTTICPVTEATYAPTAPASKPSAPASKPSAPASLPPASMPPASMPPASMPPASMPVGSAPPASMPPASMPPASMPPASMPPASMPAPPASMPPASMPANSPSAPAVCQPITVTVTVTKGSEAPPASMPVVAPTGSVPAPSPTGSPSGGMPSAPPSGSAPPAVPSNAAPSAGSSKPPAAVPSSQAPAQSSSPATPAASGSACPTSLTGAYQTPHLIVPISSEHPDEAYGTSYNGEINSTMNTIFNFDIPQDYKGKQCSIIFLFPKKEDLETSSYDFGGSGSLGCAELSSAASQKTSYGNAPSVKKDLGSIALQPGNSYVVATGDCQAGTTQSIELSSQNGLSLSFFEDYNPSPLGLYITSC